MTGYARFEIAPDGSTALFNDAGEIVSYTPGPTERSTLDVGCDCCDQLPAGTAQSVLALLDDDHPAARLLREATSDD